MSFFKKTLFQNQAKANQIKVKQKNNYDPLMYFKMVNIVYTKVLFEYRLKCILSITKLSIISTIGLVRFRFLFDSIYKL